MENADLKGQIQEKVFVTTSLQNELRRLKGKHVLDNATIITNATTIAQGMFKLDIEPISHRLKNNRDAHEDYLKKTIENTDTIRGLVERARKQNPSKSLLDSACKFIKHVQELFTPMKVVHLKETTSNSVVTPKPEIKVYSRRPKQIKTVGSSKKAKIVESRNANNSKPNHSWGSNAIDVPSCSSLVNDRLSRVFSGSRDTNLYTISLDDMLKTSPICLLSKALKTKSWLWHRRLSYLNSGTLNKLAKDGIARGIPKVNFKKDHLCSTCALGKSKKSSHQPKAEDTN
ncbi:retrovirus-related pol polyprotein from transposon TNT 1-94 [Tanacetum coccineum]